jgi:NADPH2:quinone reductase
MLTKKGGPEVLKVVELPIENSGPGQLRVGVLAAGIGSTDLSMLTGNYMYSPKIPFVPGYEVAGVVDAIGHGVKGFELNQRVAALTVHGGFAELLVRDAEHFLPIPDGVSDRDAAAVILNYVTAWAGPLREDLPKIFALLKEKTIDPLVQRTFALLQVRQAMELLATGSVEGKIVLIG